MFKSAFIIAVGCVATAAGAQQPQPFEASQTKKVTGTIEAVSQSDRHVTVLGSNGSRVILEAGAQIQNFDQLRPGDRVVVAYHEGLIAEVARPGEGAQSQTQRTERVQGDMPTKMVGTQTTKTVEIESVDRDRNMVTFKHPDGTSRTLGVSSLKAKEFVSQLNPGDEVQLTFREAAAVSIKPAAGRLSSAEGAEGAESEDSEDSDQY